MFVAAATMPWSLPFSDTETARFILLGLFGWALLLGLVGPLAPRLFERLLALPAILALWLPLAGTGGPLELWDWAPHLGLSLTLSVDGLAQVFAFAVLGIGALVMVYAPGYMEGDARRFRLYAWLYAFLAAMLGLVVADNVFAAFVFWELTSVTSFFLIAYKAKDEAARQAAQSALTVTAMGGLALLGGLVLLAQVTGATQFSAMRAPDDTSLASAALVLILVGCATKSAQVPFQFWLPRAMTAPTPVSSYLHSAAMVAAGVFLALRLSPIAHGVEWWPTALMILGAATAVVGAWLALGKSDLKQILAYTTVSSLGVMLAVSGASPGDGWYAALAYFVAHALYKCALFMVAGSLEHATGTRDLRILGGLGRRLPGLGLAAALAGVSAFALVGTAGFVAKEIALKAAGTGAELVSVAVLVSGLVSSFVVGAIVIRAFFGPERTPVEHGLGARLWVPPMILGFAGLSLGLIPGAFSGLLGSAGASTPSPVTHPADVWFGFSGVFALTAGSWILAAFAVPRWEAVQATVARWAPERPAARDWWDGALNGILGVAEWTTRRVQSGYLRRYVITTLVALLGLVALAMTQGTPDPGDLLANLEPSPVAWYDVLVVAAIVGAAGLAVSTSGRLTAIASMGVIGLGVAFLYASFGGPDLAMTQFIVETLTVVMFVLVFYHLPKFRRITRRRSRAIDVVIATAFGAVMCGLVLLALGSPPSPSISDWHLANAYPEGQGRNVVNVILVDFRALDTLGEILVLAVAAIGVVALLRLRPSKKEGSSSSP